MHQIIAEVQQVGALDPAARDRLLEDLNQTDPKLWPLVLQQVRANLAWRQQGGQESPGGSRPEATAPEAAPRFRPPVGPTAMRPGQVESDATGPPANPSGPHDVPSPPGTEIAAAQAEPRPAHAPPGTKPQNDPPSSSDRVAQSPPPDRATPPPPNRVTAASYHSQSVDDWKSHLSEAIRLLESNVAQSPESDRDFAQHARLRLLHLVNTEREAALRPIPTLALAMQEFWSKQLYGLATLLETDLISEPSRRNAEAKEHLGSAATKLGESCPLVVRGLAFVTDIQSYGVYTPFEKYEFAPGQRVLLYAEVENFQSKETAKGYHTASRSSFQIFDSSGRRVADHEFATNEEYCRNPRRDFFISYDFCLPERIFPGKHTVQLTVVDLNSQKLSQSSIEFSVKSTDH